MATRAMQEATFMILTALANGSQHGYGIIADVRDISGGQVRLRAGTLYTALDRLRADELIAVDRQEVVDGRLRRYLYCFRTRRRCCDLRLGRMGWLRQDRGSCVSGCST